MNEQLQVAMTEILTKTVKNVGTATDFLLTETPEVIQQLLSWKMAESICITVLSILWAIFVCTAVFKLFNHLRKKLEDPYDPEMAYFSFVGLFLLVPSFASANIDWLQIWIAPKVYLIEYTAALIK